MSYTLLVRQVLTPLVNRYNISVLADDGSETAYGRAVQKRLTVREQLRVDHPDGRELFTVRAQNVLELAGRYDVTADGEPVATLEKQFGTSLFRSTYLLRCGDATFIATERNLTFALLRRLVGDVLPFWPFPLQFDLRTEAGAVIGNVDRKFGFRDMYRCRITDDRIPREAAAALTLGLDAFMNR